MTTPSIFNASLAGHALLGHLLEVPDHDPGDVDGEGRPCRDCIYCGRPRLDGIRLCEECARYLRLRRLGVPAATIVGMVDAFCHYGADRFDRAGYRAALEALARAPRSG